MTVKTFLISKKNIENYNKSLAELFGFLITKSKDENSNSSNLVFLFGNNKKIVQEIIQEIHNLQDAQLILKTELVGCTTAGTIFQDQVLDDEDVSIAVLKLNSTQVQVKEYELKSYDESFELGQVILNDINKNYSNTSIQENKLAIILSEGIFVNGENLVNAVSNNNCPVIGVLAGDNYKTIQTDVFLNSGIKTKSVLVVFLSGSRFNFIHESQSGLSSFGIERQVTKSKGNVVYELDHRPILDVYTDFLGENAEEKMAIHLMYSLEISEKFQRNDGFIRTPLMVDPKNKSIMYTGEIPEGAFVRLMLAQNSKLIDAATNVTENCLKKIPKKIIESQSFLSLVFSCASRRMGLGIEVEEELYINSNDFPINPPQTGLYGYGEVIYKNNHSSLENQTFSKLIIYEN